MNFEKVVINADSLSPPLVVVAPIYSCAAESDWKLTTSDVSYVFDAEHIKIGLIQVYHNIKNHSPLLYAELRRTRTFKKVSVILRFLRGQPKL